MASFPTHDTPASLLEQLRQPGDAAAWDRFVRLYTPFLHLCIRRLGLQESDRADLLQETFLLLYQKLPEFEYDQTKSFRGWLRTLLQNKWRDAQRRRQRLRIDGDKAAVAEQAVADDVAAFAEAEYRQYLVNRALELMRSDFQPATWQACWENAVVGRPATEVAAQLGITTDAVYAATYRVLRRLRQELNGLLS